MVKEFIKNIESGIGLGDLKFGMTQEEVKCIIGLPNQIETYYNDLELNILTEHWEYETLGLSMSFSSEDDWKLATMATESNYYLLWDSIHIGQTMQQVEELLISLGKADYICEDFSNIASPDHKLFELEESYINLWFDDRVMSQIQWSPKFKDENTINWPYQSELKEELTDIGFKRYAQDILYKKLKLNSEKWLEEIFSGTSKDNKLISKFPPATNRENLTTENDSITYNLNVDSKVPGSILAKAKLIHNDFGTIGWMGVLWDNDLKALDDILFLYHE